MRFIISFLVLSLMGFVAQASVPTSKTGSVPTSNTETVPKKNELQTVSYVDLSKYAGRWYQIARNPLKFEPLVCACAQQTLMPAENGKISVYNSCNVNGPNGPLSGIKGFATVVDTKTNAKFEVDLNLGKLGQYWIIGLAKDYRWAVVSDPTRASLYILSKTPEMEPSAYIEALTSIVITNSVNLTLLKPTDHTGCTYPEM